MKKRNFSHDRMSNERIPREEMTQETDVKQQTAGGSEQEIETDAVVDTQTS
jgi:hypothetical protein